ncbi:MAG: hypothetical protein AAF713_19750 [Pseudomonadota bacterium]
MTGRYFAILAGMRTGSNLLEDLIDQLPGTHCYGELFNPAFAGRPGKEEILGTTIAERDRDPLRFLSAIVADGASRGCLPGFRLFPSHAPAVRRFLLTDPNCIRIVLTRDPLEAWVSLAIARKTGQWRLQDLAQRRAAKARFDGDDFAEYRAATAEDRQELEAAPQDTFWIDYADLTSRDLPRRLAAHLGLVVPHAPVVPRLLRQNPGPLTAKVANAGEMFAWLTADTLVDPAPVPDPRQAVLARGVSLAALPVPGTGIETGHAVMAHLAARRWGSVPDPELQVAANPGPKTLIAAGYDAAKLPDFVARRTVFATVAHPMTRAWGLFLASGQGDDAPWHALTGRFETWLAQQSRVSIPSQVQCLTAWRTVLRIDQVWPTEASVEMARRLVRQLNLEPLGPEAEAVVAAQMPEAPPEEVSTPELQARARALWPEDYAVFRYDASRRGETRLAQMV